MNDLAIIIGGTLIAILTFIIAGPVWSALATGVLLVVLGLTGWFNF